MEKQTIYFEVGSGQEMTRKSALRTFAIETVNYIDAHFELPAAWYEFEKLAAVWYTDKGQAVSEIDNNGQTVIPPEILRSPGSLHVNLCGTNFKEGRVFERLTTYSVEALRLEYTDI